MTTSARYAWYIPLVCINHLVLINLEAEKAKIFASCSFLRAE